MEGSNNASSSPVTVSNESSPCHHHPSSSADVTARGQSLSLRDDVAETDQISPEVNHCHRLDGDDWCGGRANGGIYRYPDEPASSDSAQVDGNSVSPLSESDSDSLEADVTSDLPEVGSDDDDFITDPPPPGELNPAAATARPRNTFECARKQGALVQMVQDNGGPESELQSRRPGIAEYFNSRRQRPVSVAGWKLFGKVPPKQSPSKQARIIQQEFEARQVAARSSPTHNPAAQQTKRKVEFEPLSTTALILEDRPLNLPAKSAEETQRHRQQYEQMVAGAKRRELKEAQRRHQQIKERLRQEEGISKASLVWIQDILPHWDAM